MFNKIIKKQNEVDLSKQTIENKIWRERLLKFAEKMLEEAKLSDFTLQEFRMAGELAMQIIQKTQESTKLTDIFYVRQTEKGINESKDSPSGILT